MNQHGIKGLGPAVVSLLYSTHPTLAIPFNTTIVNGYNALTGSRVKLGKWDHYLVVYGDVLSLSSHYHDLLSSDLGAVAGLLFGVGMGRYPAPSRRGNVATIAEQESNLAKVHEEAVSFAEQFQVGRTDDASHTEVQGWLRDLGKALGSAVQVATNDRSRPYNSGMLSDSYLATLPNSLLVTGAGTVPLIDVVWLNAALLEVEAAFEAEHTTSIYSGIVRPLDLALGTEQPTKKHPFLVAPDRREVGVHAQLTRPAFSRVSELGIRYVLYASLTEYRETMARFGTGIKPVEAIAKTL